MKTTANYVLLLHWHRLKNQTPALMTARYTGACPQPAGIYTEMTGATATWKEAKINQRRRAKAT